MNENTESRRPPEELVVVCRTAGLMRAHVIKGKLESVGIPAMLKYETEAVIGVMGEVQVLVPKSREQEALEALKTD